MGVRVVGVDGGGGHTAACLVDERGRVLAEAEAKASNPRVVGVEAASAAVARAVAECMARAGLRDRLPDALHCGLSGAGRADERAAVRAALEARRVAARVEVGHDAALVLAAGGIVGAGIAIVAGTGSFVWGRDA